MSQEDLGLPQANSKDWWEGKARKYIRARDERSRPEEASEAAKQCIGSVLEIGPAFGHFSGFLPPKTQYIGIEVSDLLCQQSRINYPERIFVRADFMHIGPAWRQSVDTVVAFQVLEHFHKPEEVMDVIRDIARKRVVISVPRGMPSDSQREKEGHVFGWADEASFAAQFATYGAVSFWDGADNHICGVLEW